MFLKNKKETNKKNNIEQKIRRQSSQAHRERERESAPPLPNPQEKTTATHPAKLRRPGSRKKNKATVKKKKPQHVSTWVRNWCSQNATETLRVG